MFHLSPRMCLCVCGAIMSGCSTSAYFVTKTSLSIVDVDSAPAGASIAYDRVEGFFAPLNDDGTLPPVVARIETDGGLLNTKVRQIYATGDAAQMITAGKIEGQEEGDGKSGESRQKVQPALFTTESRDVVGQPTPAPADLASKANRKRRAVAFFGTSTTTGLKVGFSPSGVPNGFLLGFRRKELSVLPELHKGTDGHYVYPQLLAALDTSAQVAPNDGTRLGICQSFAAGVAAVELARAAKNGQESLSCGNASAADLFGDFNRSVARQTEMTRSALTCYSGVRQADRKPIWEDAARLGLLMSVVEGDAAEANASALAALVAADAEADKLTDAQARSDSKRKQDARYAALLTADPGGAMQDGKLGGNSTRERLLEIHEEYVCSRLEANMSTP